MKKPVQGIEAIAVQRASVVDADKVRYRVYRSPNDFVAVIAESALLAMREAGIDNPYRIVRDLPTEGISIEARRIQKQEEAPRVMMPTATGKAKEQMKTELAPPAAARSTNFVAMQAKDFQKHGAPTRRILTPDMVEPIAGGAVKMKWPSAPAASQPVAAPAPQPAAAPAPSPEPEAAPPEAAASAPETAPIAEPAPTSAEPVSEVLSEDEVQKLLNG